MRRILFILTFICCAITITAQHHKRLSHEEYCKKLQTFITECAGLTAEEAEAFFPIYFELQQNKWNIHKESRKKFKKEKGERLSDEECCELINNMAEIKIKVAQLEQSYIEKYLKVIPARKILEVQRAEDRFQREMIKNIARGCKNKKTPNN